MTTITLFQYMNRVESEAGLTKSASFPSSPSEAQTLVLNSINATLRELNNHYFLTFKQTAYTLTTTAGTASYDLRQSPYNQTFWRANRIARNGVQRVADDYPLMFIDYIDRDYLQPSLTGNSLPTHYSQYGQSMLLYPAPSGTQLRVRYYGLNIGTNAAATTSLLSLTASGDLTMLEDEWQDALAYGAACKVRRQQKVDEKYRELKAVWEEWREKLEDMMQPGGEDGFPQMMLATHNESYLDRKIGPFFNANIG